MADWPSLLVLEVRTKSTVVATRTWVSLNHSVADHADVLCSTGRD